MAKIDFYILSEDNTQALMQFACRLIEKAYQNQHRIYIHTDNEKDAHTLDELLWTYKDVSFLPHHLYGEGPEPAPPIQIGFGITPEKQRDILINLSQSVPPFYQQFSRVLELIINTPETRMRARDNYRYYRSENQQITTHQLQPVE